MEETRKLVEDATFSRLVTRQRTTSVILQNMVRAGQVVVRGAIEKLSLERRVSAEVILNNAMDRLQEDEWEEALDDLEEAWSLADAESDPPGA